MDLYQFSASKPQFASLAVVGEPDLVIEGKHCSVACYRIAEQSDGEKWHFSPCCIPVGRTFSSDSDEEWISNAISYLPNMDFFANFTSFAQVQNWVSYRDQAIVLALCFWADEEQLFLKDELKEGRIDQFSYNYALAVAKIYKNLWKLIKVDETGIQKILSNASNFPFDSSRALFVEIVREVIEGEFCSCLKRRYIYNASHINKIAKLKRKVHQETASSAEISKLYKLIDQYVPFSIWLNRLLIVADRLSSKNSLVKEYLENYRDGISTLAKLQIQRDCNPDFRHHKISTHTWERGQRYQGVLSWKA